LHARVSGEIIATNTNLREPDVDELRLISGVSTALVSQFANCAIVPSTALPGISSEEP